MMQALSLVLAFVAGILYASPSALSDSVMSLFEPEVTVTHFERVIDGHTVPCTRSVHGDRLVVTSC